VPSLPECLLMVALSPLSVTGTIVLSMQEEQDNNGKA
jgi:hypothetical protein